MDPPSVRLRSLDCRREPDHNFPMYAMTLAAIVLISIAGFVAIVWAITDPPAKSANKIATVLVSIALIFIGLLAFGQRQVCSSLGGKWISGNQACTGEWGGRDGANT